ncbi:hypothetical protein Hanom_Chr05g00397371 [Helianthus anomalus]
MPKFKTWCLHVNSMVFSRFSQNTSLLPEPKPIYYSYLIYFIVIMLNVIDKLLPDI